MPDIEQQTIRAGLKFLADRSAPLVYVPSKGGGDETEHIGNFHTREVAIQNGRRALAATDLDREGFVLQAHESAVADFYEDAALREIYHGELEGILRGVTGARRVEVFDDTRRSSCSRQQRARGIREPANIVHNDYTAASGPRRLADHFAGSPTTLRDLQARRFAIVNVWRPIGAPVMRQPLTLCDATSVREDDLVPVERRAEERVGELQVAVHNPQQRWYYYSQMHRGEVLLFKTFDSACEGRTRFTLHTAFTNPFAPEDAPPRESLESRCLVFF
jgi:hypothetical protein